MHRFANSPLLVRLKFSALIVIMRPLLAIALAFVLTRGLLQHDTELLKLSLELLVANFAAFLLLAMIGFSIRCPLCRASLIKKEACSIHSKAERTLGSVRLSIATGTLLRGHFRCPYCGEHCDTVTPRRHGKRQLR